VVVAVRPCHLRHVSAHEPVGPCCGTSTSSSRRRQLCCGAGGAYAALHPAMAADIRDRKLESIRRSGAPVVASANPGCTMHLAAAGVDIRHPLEIVAAVLDGAPDPVSPPSRSAGP
jgi:glycolate oxidase iron-sulfur subunit